MSAVKSTKQLLDMTSTASETSSTPRDPYRDSFSLTFSFFDNKTTKWRDDKKKSNNSEEHPLQTAKIIGSTSSKNLLVFAGNYTLVC